MRTTKFFFAVICILQSYNLFAQAPQAIPYQGVARNAAGNILASQAISLRITIHEGNANGMVSFIEVDTVTTNNLGLFSMNIGNGIPVIGTLSTVNWKTGNKFLQVEMDPSGGSSYFDMGTQQLMSVPYALFATSSATSGDNQWTILGADIYNNNSGNVGIASTSPEFRLSLDNDGGILAKGTWNAGNTLTTSGSGVRMFWYPRKAAFRAGEASGDSWDDVNINYGSAAFGYATKATGSTSFAAGIGSIASGSSAVAFGDHATASGETSSAFGYYNTAGGNHSFAAGNSNSATGLASFAVGDSNTVTGKYSSAFGKQNNISGEGSTAFGLGNDASGDASFAEGLGSKADGDFSIALGTLAQNNNFKGSFVFGDASTLAVDNSYVKNTADNQFMVRASGGYVFYNDLSLSAANSMVFKGGKLGVGTQAPVNKLNIMGAKSNPTIPGTTSSGIFRIAVANDEGIDFGKTASSPFAAWIQSGFQASTTDPLALQPLGGKVGIGTMAPINILDLEGSLAVGTNYSGSWSAPVNGAIIEGNVGIGTTGPFNKLDIEGSLAVGTNYSGSSIAPVNGAIIEGNVGIGTSAVVNKLDIKGGVAVGTNYAGTTGAPANGVIIEGRVGIGTDAPLASVKLDVDGAVKVGTNGTAITNIIKGAVNVDLPSIAANTSLLQTYSITNAATGSTVSISFGGALPDGLVVSYARVSTTNTVEVKFRNTSATAVDAGAMNFYITVIQ